MGNTGFTVGDPRAYPGPVRGAIFDWAGTTCDYGCRAPALVFVEVFRQKGVEISLAEARGPMGSAKKDHIRQITLLPEVADRWRAAYGRPVAEADVGDMYQAFVPLQIDCIAQYADLVPGTVETIDRLRARGINIGSTTGYSTDMMAVLAPEAKRRGYEPDSCVTASDVPAGRPAPWMALLCAQRLGVFPPASIVKIGDTVPDIDEGLNAGMWTIAVSKTGNELGLSEPETAALAPAQLASRLAQIADRLARAGAHYVVESIADCIAAIDDIERRLKNKERP